MKRNSTITTRVFVENTRFSQRYKHYFSKKETAATEITVELIEKEKPWLKSKSIRVCAIVCRQEYYYSADNAIFVFML